MMSKRTKACNISAKVKALVWKRDNHYCVLCGSPYAMPNAHFIPRSQGGLGVEENIVTLCNACHREFDQTTNRSVIREELRLYLKSKYPDWDERKLFYKK